MAVGSQVRLGEILLQSGYIDEEKLSFAIEKQQEDKTMRLGEMLMNLGMITEDQLLFALSKRLGHEIANFKEITLDLAAVRLIPKAFCLKYNVIATNTEEDVTTIIVADPLDFYAIEDVKSIVNTYCKILIGKKEDIIKAVNTAYSEIDAQNAAIKANLGKVIEETPIISADEEDLDSPVINLVNSIISKAYNEGASDIHIEPFEDHVNIRLRIDGQLLDYMKLDVSLANQITTRIKIISELDIAEKRIPQDGHFKIRIQGKDVSVRVSSIPTVFGEKLVFRFLSQMVKLDYANQYGMNPENYKKIERILSNSHGIIFITGPTGSGKTTTLYMMLEKMTENPVNVSTIEDPVERNIEKINQVQINPQAGLTFESGLRAMLRQDPDVILVGETRDPQTASVAVTAALTGHLVFTTLHTNDAIRSIVRLEDMGIESYLIANSMVGVVAQRLVKKICPSCSYEYEPTEDDKRLIPGVTKLKKGKGCPNCKGTGYKGRIAVHEVLEVDSTIRKMISEKQGTEKIQQYVTENNLIKLLRENIVELILEGTTTVEELLRQTSFVGEEILKQR